MAGTTAGDGGLDDPDRAWRRPSPVDPPEREPERDVEPRPAAERGVAATPVWARGGAADRGEVRWEPASTSSDASSPSRASSSEAARAPEPDAAWRPVGGEPQPSPHPPAPERSPAPSPVGAWRDVSTDDVAIDEQPAAAPRASGGGPGGGWWRRAGVAAAVVAVVVVAGAVVSGGDDPDEAGTAPSATTSPTTSSPPTTRHRAPPRTTQPPRLTTSVPVADPGAPAPPDPAEDPRVMITRLPDGFEPLHANYGTDIRMVDEIDGLLFTGDGAPRPERPWLRVQPAAAVSFAGPTTVEQDGDRNPRIGTSMRGDDTVVVEVDGATFAVTSKGLPLDAVLDFAAAVTTGPGDTWSVPAAAVPAGLRLVDADLTVPRPLHMTSFANVAYGGPDGEVVWLTSWLADERYDRLAVAPFVLDEVSYVTIGGVPGVMGTRDLGGIRGRVVQWRRGGVDIELVAIRTGETTTLLLAGEASLRTDNRWGERDWQQASSAEPTAGPAEQTALVEAELQLGGLGRAPLRATTYGGALSWGVDARMYVGRATELTDAPVVLQVATNPVPANDPTGESHVVALVLGDDVLDGATLRVRTGVDPTGAGEGPAAEAAVHTVVAADRGAFGGEGGFPYAVGAAVAVPWVQGDFLAEVIAADGQTVLATATRADLR